MSFAYPWVWVLVPLYLAAEAIIYYRIRSKSQNLPTAGYVRPYVTWRVIAVRWMRILPVIVCVLLLLGLSLPQKIGIHKHFLPSGIDILVALDVSGSMAAEDFHPQNRLEVAKDVLRDFIRGRPSDRIGLIVFAGMSVTRSPLTLRHKPLIGSVESIRMGNLPEGTAIGSAIMNGLNRLSIKTEQKQMRGDRILLLITDGRNNAGEIHPLDALSIAVERGIRIYTIGVGSTGPVPFPVLGPDGKKSFVYEKADLDEDLLREIAATTGGRYFRATDPESLHLLFEQINALEKSEPKVAESRTVESRASGFLAPALVLLFCYALLTTVIVRLP
jgi:Ca-activated chloride channel family protein